MKLCKISADTLRSPSGTENRIAVSCNAKPPRRTELYAGAMTNTSLPSCSKTPERLPSTSAKPPVLANGVTSDAINAIFIGGRGSEWVTGSSHQSAYRRQSILKQDRSCHLTYG